MRRIRCKSSTSRRLQSRKLWIRLQIQGRFRLRSTVSRRFTLLGKTSLTSQMLKSSIR
ncbi:hypothetical protein LINPERPRIM_LOCUS23113 [Linum perenne]